jgi:flotillin
MFGFLSVGLIIAAIVAWLALSFLFALFLRTVVETNEVHIVQSGKKTVSYGKGEQAGNVYYSWPSWVPKIGIKKIILPVSVFDVQLKEYAAYDKGRVPFVIDILAFFRIDEPNMAAQRVSTVKELELQLEGILKGASRSILATSPIEEILEKRAEYGEKFTEATEQQLKAWGVTNVKNIELMDIRDAQGSEVIQRIMAMKQSLIEKESRTAVAGNMQAALTAEIEAKRQVSLAEQEAMETVGKRTAGQEQAIGIAKQQAQQAIKEQERETATKSMAVQQVNTVRTAEITRDAEVVKAEQEKLVAIKVAEGRFGAAAQDASATRVKGEAEGAALLAVQLAPVNAQITLAKEIGSNKEYQQYLVTVRQIEANQVVGIEQAKALETAQIKVIANSAGPVDGVKTVMDMFTPKGGLQVGAALEALKNTEVGAAVIGRLTGTNGNTSSEQRK